MLSLPGNVFNTVILERMKDGVDPKLRDQQAGFRTNRAGADQITTLHINVEQSSEWNSSLYEEAFDNVDRDHLVGTASTLWSAPKLVNIIKNCYGGMSYSVIHDGRFSRQFQVKLNV